MRTSAALENSTTARVEPVSTRASTMALSVLRTAPVSIDAEASTTIVTRRPHAPLGSGGLAAVAGGGVVAQPSGNVSGPSPSTTGVQSGSDDSVGSEVSGGAEVSGGSELAGGSVVSTGSVDSGCCGVSTNGSDVSTGSVESVGCVVVVVDVESGCCVVSVGSVVSTTAAPLTYAGISADERIDVTTTAASRSPR